MNITDLEKQYGTLEELRAKQERFANRIKTPITPEQQKKNEQYIEKLSQDAVKIQKEFTSYDYNQTRLIFWEELQKVNFKVNAQNKTVLQDLCTWLSGNNSVNPENNKTVIDARKGIFLCGGTGNGKTTLMKCLQRIGNGNPAYNFRGFKFKPMSEFLTEISSNKVVNDEMLKHSWCFDDIGINYYEVSKIYGNKFHPLPYLIDLMYLGFKNGKLIHVTSNLSPKEIMYENPNVATSERKFKDGFDERIRSRLFEMFNFVVNDDKDHRVTI